MALRCDILASWIWALADPETVDPKTTIRPFLNGWLLGTAFLFLIFGAFLSVVLRGVQSRRWPAATGRVV